MNESLARDALRRIEALKRRVAELESELAKSRGQSPPDRSGLKGAIADATSRGLPNSFAVPGFDAGGRIEKAHRRAKGQT